MVILSIDNFINFNFRNNLLNKTNKTENYFYNFDPAARKAFNFSSICEF